MGVVLALFSLGRHHLVEPRSSHVMAFRVVVGQQAVLAAILALEWMTAGRVDQLAHDPWLWMGAVLQLALVGGWRLLERVAMAMADGLQGVPAVRGREVASGSSIAPRGRVVRGTVTGLSTRAPPASALLPGPTG